MRIDRHFVEGSEPALLRCQLPRLFATQLGMKRACTGLIAVALLGCSSGGRYGYARNYTYIDNEGSFARRVDVDAVYDEVRRMPDHYAGHVLAWFGVVTGVENAGGGTYRVAMQFHTHQERHLCEDESDSSCRVTISEQGGGPFTALVRLTPEDQVGEHRVQPYSLLKIYGPLVLGEYDAQGGPIVRAEYYRQWPHGQYVTTAAANQWRR